MDEWESLIDALVLVLDEVWDALPEDRKRAIGPSTARPGWYRLPDR